MAITNLTGYTWVGNEIVSLRNSWTYNLTFISDDAVFNSISVSQSSPIPYLYYDDSWVFEGDMDTWLDEVFQTIVITDGSDVTNSTLIAWLEANGTLTAPQPQTSPSISIGSLPLSNIFIGSAEIAKVILNGITLYEKIFYSITVTLTNATASQSNPSVIAEDGTATLVFTFDGTSYICPSTSPVVTGATGVWTKNSDVQGTMVLSNANGNVSFTVAGEQALPQLDTPTNLSVTDNVASFDEVENAEKYEFFVDDVSIGEYPTVTLISFSITLSGNSTTYQAEDGMTWTEWVASEYNTGFYMVDESLQRIIVGGGDYVRDAGNSAVAPSDLIVANYAYNVSSGGSN